MNSYELLVEAKKLIEDPKNWTQDTYARDKYGKSVSVNDKTATCFCSIGALYRTVHDKIGYYEYQFNLIDLAERALSTEARDAIEWFNDNSSHSDVMRVWDKAIKRLDPRKVEIE